MSVNDRKFCGLEEGEGEATKEVPDPHLAARLNTATLPRRHPASLRPSINTGWQVSDDSRSTVGSYKDMLWGWCGLRTFWNSQTWGPWRKSSTSPAPIAVTLWDSQANNYAGNTLFLPLGCSWLPPNWNLLVRPGPPWWFSSESACQCRGHGFDLWAGKATKHCATTTEPVSSAWELQPLHPHILNPYKACILDPGLCTKRRHHSERPVHLNEDPVYK